MKILKTLIFFIVTTALQVQVFASSVEASASSVKLESEQKRERAFVYPDEEGSLLFKLRGSFAMTSGKTKGLPVMGVSGNPNLGKFTKGGYNIDGAVTIFVTDNMAAEVSLGLVYYRTKSTVLAAAADIYGTQQGATGKKNIIYMIPTSLAVQYHIAPFGGIRPYFGAGYSGIYIHTRAAAFKTANTYGPLIQAGIDFICKDDTLFTFDVRQYFFHSKVTFKSGLIGGTDDVGARVTWNPLVISAGIGFKF